MITYFVAVFCVERNVLNTLLVLITISGLNFFWDDHTFCGSLLCGKKCPEYFVSFDDNFWDLNFFEMITHFVVVI